MKDQDPNLATLKFIQANLTPKILCSRTRIDFHLPSFEMSELNRITEEEAELYDRQIRLWGAGVQRSLRNTRVLVVGMNGVAAEVCKNLILSGVKSLTMMDHEHVVKEDLTSQYFLSPESVGRNKAQASLKSAQVLNPNVKVTVDTSSPLDKSINYYSDFDVVCVTKQDPSVITCINDICQIFKIKFFSGDSFGMFGYLFEDLSALKENAAPVTFSYALNYHWTPKTSLKRRKFEDPSYLLFKILMEFRKVFKRNPSREYETMDAKSLLSLRDSILKKFKVDGDLLPEEYLHNVYGEFGPTCSIIGGMIAQEVVKSLSKDATLSYSIYLFNHLRCQMSGMSVEDSRIQSTSSELAAPSETNNIIENNAMEIL